MTALGLINRTKLSATSLRTACTYSDCRQQKSEMMATTIIHRLQIRVRLKHIQTGNGYQRYNLVQYVMHRYLLNLTLNSHKEYTFNAMLQSDPGPGVPKNYNDLLKTNDLDWIWSLRNKLNNFLKQDAWEFISCDQLGPTIEKLSGASGYLSRRLMVPRNHELSYVDMNRNQVLILLSHFCPLLQTLQSELYSLSPWKCRTTMMTGKSIWLMLKLHSQMQE